MSIEVSDWLRGLGLDQYAAAFRNNDIDDAVLRRLTAEDLRDLGVASVGHRRRLLDAIAALSAPTPATDAPRLPDETTASLAPKSDAERRQLTVIFCDLVGSTALSARLDPEDLREIIAAYHRAVADVVRSLDGFVAKYMGDGILVYFGYPRAHEDDAERAVRAGLGVIDVVRRLDISPLKLQARVGIATGLVVVGDLIGEGSAQEQSVVGETPNLAARLQALAEPDTVVIATGTRRLVGALFEYRDLGAIAVKGIAGPVPAWQVLRPSGVESRFEALRGSALARLVGRDEEIELILRRWQQAKSGEGRVVLISGEPGIGKSRLTAALSEHLGTEPHTRLRHFCSPYHQETAFYPVIAQLERAAGFARHDTAAEKLVKLRALLAPGSRANDEAELIAELLSLPCAAADRDLTLQCKRERLFEFEALRTAALSPLVGRDEEVALLLRRWARAAAGEGQVVLIAGEPGIGKSRLAAALQQRLGDEAHTRLRYFCSPHHRDSPLYPFIAQLERAAGLAREDPPAAKLDKLEALLAQAGAVDGETAGLFADLLGLPAESRYPPLPQDPQRRREMTLSALLAQFEALARRRPVLIMFEDAHWADSTSLELLDRTFDRLAHLSALVVITFRPEFAAPWIGAPHVSALSLSRLAQRETTALVHGITAGKRLPSEILDRVVERTDGIPLFVEELTKSLLEGGLLHEEGDGYALAGPLPPLAIPSSLQDSLMARLDRLAPVKEVAQIGAAIGREFSWELLAAVARRSDAELRAALDRLTEAGLVFRRGTPPRALYIFKHALVQAQ